MSVCVCVCVCVRARARARECLFCGCWVFLGEGVGGGGGGGGGCVPVSSCSPSRQFICVYSGNLLPVVEMTYTMTEVKQCVDFYSSFPLLHTEPPRCSVCNASIVLPESGEHGRQAPRFGHSSHISDFSISTAAATLPDAWRSRVCARIGWPGASSLRLG